MAEIAPTLLCADPLALGEAVRRLDRLDIPWHHVDVMDGRFVPNLAFGTLAVARIKAAARRPVAAHLMVESPAQYVEPFARAGVDRFVFHLEAERNPFRLARAAREAGMRPGVALNPITPVQFAAPLLPFVDVVTLMAVEPGFSGQPFMESTYGRIGELRALSPDVLIEVDGGIDEENGAACAALGADVLVGGAFTLFCPGEPLETRFEAFRRALSAAGRRDRPGRGALSPRR